MKPTTRVLLSSLPLLLTLGVIPILGAACSDSHGANGPDRGTAAQVVDQPLASFQLDQLELAFETASKLPLVPHVKNRARAQEQVVTTCFALEQPQRALEYIEEVPNWRRGLGYANYALYCAERGDTSRVQFHLDRARTISEDPEDDTLPGWRKSRIRATIARTHVQLGQLEQAAEFGESLEDSEACELAVLQARLSDESRFETDLELTNAAIQAGSMEQVQNSLEQCVEYFDRYYEDEERRDLAESKIALAEGKLPLLIHLDLLMKLTDAALGHEDPTKATELLAWIDRLVVGQQGQIRHELPVIARVSVLRHRAGDVGQAREDIDAALAKYEEQVDTITDIFRAGAVTPLAEAYHRIGDDEAARAVYAMAVEGAVHNPNSRPRAMDLTAILCSMAGNEIEADAALWARLREACDALGEPW